MAHNQLQIGEPPNPVDIRWIRPDAAAYREALHLVLGGSARQGERRTSQAVEDLLARAARGTIRVTLLAGAFLGPDLVSAALAVEDRGSAALALFPTPRSPGLEYETTVLVLQALRVAVEQRPLALLQSLISRPERMAAAALQEAGFHFLTALVYLESPVRSPRPRTHAATGLQWVVYDPANEPLFCDALKSSYINSLDCPELSGLRSPADALASHRATGVFDAAFWWAALRDGRPVGILLVNPLPNGSTFEIVYVGVAHDARGTGVGDALLERAVFLALRGGASRLALAVDEHNHFALGLYKRWGFHVMAQRDAWLANLRQRGG